MTTFAEPTVRRFTRDEYYSMGDLGLFEGQRVELIDGEIIQMAPQKDLHAVGIALAAAELERACGPGHWVRQQLPVRVSKWSEPEPDLAVVTGVPRDYVGTDHPTAALLLVEVSDATLRYDRTRKASLYASAGFDDYWILNVKDRQLEVHRDRIADPAAAFGYRYATVTVAREGDQVTPLAVPTAAIAVADLLP